MEKQIHNRIQMTGEVKFRVASLDDHGKDIEQKILHTLGDGGDAKKDIELLNDLYCSKEIVEKNIVTTSMHEMIADYISSISPTNDIVINYGALGTGIVTPVVSDTILSAEAFRKQISSLSSSGDTVYVTVFYSTTDIDGTFYEHAFFSDASITADSGVMVNRVLIDAPTGIAKSNSETLTIDYTLTIQ